MIKMNASRSGSSPGAVKIIKQGDREHSKNINTSEFYHSDDLPFANRDQFQGNHFVHRALHFLFRFSSSIFYEFQLKQKPKVTQGI